MRTYPINIGGDFVRNGGVFEPDEGTVTFDGSGNQILDTDAITFYDLRVDSGSTLVDLAQNSASLIVDGALTNNGALQKNQEVNGTADVDYFNTGGYGGLTLNANGSDLGSTLVEISGNQDCTVTAGETVQRCFDITPANTTGRNATATFYFAEGELSGNTCGSLVGYHWNGFGWDALTTGGHVCESEPYSVQSSGVSDFSLFVLKSDGPPVVYVIYLPLILR
jgi:FlaG/FlaF family flagellin (archaellin)